MLTPEQIAELKVLMEKATPLPHTVHRYDHGGGRVLIDEPKGTRKLIADFYHEEDREWWLALVNAAPALLAAAERDAGMCPMLDAEPDRVIVTGLAHGGCRLRHALEVRADATFDPRSLYVRSARIAELEAALAKQKEKNDAAVMAAIDLFAANATWGKHAGLGCCAKSRCEGGVRDDLITAANNSLRRVLGIAGGDDRVVKRINEINDKREALAAEEGA